MSNSSSPKSEGYRSEMSSAKDKGQEAIKNAGDALDHAKSGSQKLATDVANKAGQVASQAASSISEASQQVGEKADQAAAAMGQQMAAAGEGLRSRLPDNGMLHSAGEQVASAMESGGQYLQDRQLSGSMEDLTALVKKYPLQSLAIGLGVGFLFARIFTPSRGA